MKKIILSMAVSILMTFIFIPLGAETVMAQDEQYTTVTKNTHSMTNGTYVVNENVTIDPVYHTGNGIQVEKGAKVLLIIEEGKTLKVTGKDAVTTNCGFAAILLPGGSTLTVAGKGTLEATGGKAGRGNPGGRADRSQVHDDSDEKSYTGNGGGGGAGGGGAGAGIGTNGGGGGNGGARGEGISVNGMTRSNVYGNDGKSGGDGSLAEPAGTVIVTGSVTVNATGGKAGSGGDKGFNGMYHEWKDNFVATACGTSGGGGSGAGGSAADGIGSGGTGGGGGGGGASANIDGEGCLFGAADLDDLWGYGGYGGSSVWGGESGKQGYYGATQNGDDTDASRKYAKSGGVGGSSAAPRTVAFYTYKDSDSSNPKVTCTSGHGVTRGATPLGTLQEFLNQSALTDLVSGGTFTYDGESHVASVGQKGNMNAQSYDANAFRAQADDDAVYSGTVIVDSHSVDWSIAYYDEAGKKLDSEPIMPGQYAAVVTFTCTEYEPYNGDWVVPVTINKRQVEKPVPAALTFECKNWDTGEGTMQEAFPGLNSADYKFVPDAKTADDTASLSSANAAGEYQACFRLNDPEKCAWAGESEDAAETWVPWSIALAPFDPADPEVMYWGSACNNAGTSLAYTGEPVWVRPWFTVTKSTGGEFPDWFTHWGGKDRPTTDRRSTCVLYMKGDDDCEGLIGYHENTDGSLEKVTGEQVYAWMFGVDIDGKHVIVESGDKVWYKTGEDGWKVPLAVGETGPEGAEGCVIARDLSYADHLGVMEIGSYKAYAYFDEEAGFAPISTAEADVTVSKTVRINSRIIDKKTVESAIRSAGGNVDSVTTVVLGKNVKKISKGSFKNFKNAKTLVVKSKKLKKKTVKGSLKGSKISKVKVQVGKKKVNKKYVKKYKKIFTKKNAGKKVKVSL